MNSENSTNSPSWGRKIDDHRHRWYQKHEKPFHKRRGEYIGAIIWNLIWFYIVNHVTKWDLPFINDHYPTVLWALNMNIFIQICGNVLMFIFDIYILRRLAKIIMESANFLTLIILYYIYPFDFSRIVGWHWVDIILPIIFIIGMVGSAISIISNLWRLVFGREH